MPDFEVFKRQGGRPSKAPPSIAGKIPRGFCVECGGPMPMPKASGRPRDTCSDRCRRRKSRRRTALPWPPVPIAGYPSDPKAVRRRTVEALIAVLDGQQAAPAEDQLAQGLLEVQWISYRLASLERDLPVRLGGRAAELGRRIREAAHAVFPELVEVVGNV